VEKLVISHKDPASVEGHAWPRFAGGERAGRGQAKVKGKEENDIKKGRERPEKKKTPRRTNLERGMKKRGRTQRKGLWEGPPRAEGKGGRGNNIKTHRDQG